MANSPLPLLLGAAAAFLLLGKSKGGGNGGGNGGDTQENIHLVEEGDSLESFIAEAVSFSGGERLVLVMSSFAPYGPEKIGEALLPYAQANPKFFFVVMAGKGLDAAAAWLGDPSAGIPTNKFLFAIADSVGEADNLKEGITAENAAATLDEMIKWAVETELQAASASGGSPGIRSLRLDTSRTATASTGMGMGKGDSTGSGGGIGGLRSAPAGFSPEVVDKAVLGILERFFAAQPQDTLR